MLLYHGYILIIIITFFANKNVRNACTGYHIVVHCLFVSVALAFMVNFNLFFKYSHLF